MPRAPEEPGRCERVIGAGDVQPLARVADLLRELRRARLFVPHVHAGRDKTGTTEFENTDEDYLNVVVLHDDGDDRLRSGSYVSFDLSTLAAEPRRQMGINLLLPTLGQRQQGA